MSSPEKLHLEITIIIIIIEQARCHSLPDDQVSLDQISDTKTVANVGNWKRRMPEQYAANFVLSGIILDVQIIQMKFTNS